MKSEQLEEIQAKERLLDQQLEDAVYEEKKLRRLQEEDEEFFYQMNQVFDGLLEQFNHNQFAWYLEDQQEGLNYDHATIQDAVEEELQLYKQQQQTFEEQQSDLAFERLHLQNQEDRSEVLS